MTKRSRLDEDLIHELDNRIELSDILSAAEKEETRKKAREHVADQRREKAVKKLFDEEVRRAEQELDPDEMLMDIYIDLPEFAPLVRIDNTVYFHGITYEVTMSKWQSMRDMIARAWEHQAEIEGKMRTSDATRRHMTTALSPRNPQGMKLTTTDALKSIR
jgi:hypothetical protein